jgi:hypothetical protein
VEIWRRRRRVPSVASGSWAGSSLRCHRVPVVAPPRRSTFPALIGVKREEYIHRTRYIYLVTWRTKCPPQSHRPSCLSALQADAEPLAEEAREAQTTAGVPSFRQQMRQGIHSMTKQATRRRSALCLARRAVLAARHPGCHARRVWKVAMELHKAPALDVGPTSLHHWMDLLTPQGFVPLLYLEHRLIKVIVTERA